MKTICTFFILLCISAFIHAQVIHVPSEYSTIQAGIEAASEGDTVLVAEDTYFENINFLGKAIMVASEFILDGDTSHISATVIDGSQPTNPDSASVVLMCSGEDTTSVLCGFTVTGGTGTYCTRGIYNQDGTEYAVTGAGINIHHSGGKIIHNIIENNHLADNHPELWPFGGGVHAWIYSDDTLKHAVIIKDNTIRNNSISNSQYGFGAGISLIGGKGIIENNRVQDNSLDTPWNIGAGIYTASGSKRAGIVPELIIRNNEVTGNRGINTQSGHGWGGGIYSQMYFEDEGIVKVYNNIIAYNSMEGKGGGLDLYDSQNFVFEVFNNTLFNNEASVTGNNLMIDYSDAILVNNILWNEIDNNRSDVGFEEHGGIDYSLAAYNNILMEPLRQRDAITEKYSMYVDPQFKNDTLELKEGSPAIGRGIDSVQIEGNWYYAPLMDLAGNGRPNNIDPYVDMGAYESAFSRALTSIADLTEMTLSGYSLNPYFHHDSLNYSVVLIDTITALPALQAVPADPLALVEIDHAVDIFSEDPDNRTTTITVTSSDGTNQKIYRIEFYALSTVNTLGSLEAEGCTLNPPFDPEIDTYNVDIPDTTTTAPGISATATDEKAEVLVYDATMADDSHMTTRIIVKPEAGSSFNKTYRVVFNRKVDVPELESKNFVRLFPNPVNDLLTVQTNRYCGTEIEIISLNGCLVYASEMKGTILEIDLSSFDKGVYLITFRSGDFVNTRKIIKL